MCLGTSPLNQVSKYLWCIFHPLVCSSSCLTPSLQLPGNVNNHVSAKRRAQVLRKIDPNMSLFRMNHEKLMAESCLGNSLSNASSSGLKQQNQFPLPALSKEENHFFLEAPHLTQPWNRRGVACDSSTRF